MNTSSDRVLDIRKHSLRGAALGASNAGVVLLSVGEPDFDTPACIMEAQKKALELGMTHYASQLGDPNLIDAIIKNVVVPAGSSLTSQKNVLVTHGGAAGLTASIVGLINPGDVVLVENPSYSLYADSIRLAGGVIKDFGRTADNKLDFEQLRKDAKGAKMLIICQPSNPTGTILDRADWAEVAKIANESNVVVLSDEAYDGLVYDGSEFVSALDVPELAERVLVCRTFSKKYAMTGWRIGYLVGTEALIAAASIVHRTFNGSVNTANQYAAVVALEQAGNDAEVMRVEFQKRRALMAAQLEGKGPLKYTVPAGAFYFWIGYPESFGDSVEVAAKCVEKGVRVRSGSEFGTLGKYHLRLSFASKPEDIIEGCRRLLTVFGA